MPDRFLSPSARLRAAAGRWQDEAYAPREQAVREFVGQGWFSGPPVVFALNEQMRALARLPEALENAASTKEAAVHTDDEQPLAGLAEAVALMDSGVRVSLAGPGYALTRRFLSDAGVEVGVEERAAEAFTGFERSAGATEAYPCGVAVLDGREQPETCEALAEDVMLYDGASERCVRLVAAPRGLAPDRYLDAFAQFRGRVPASDRLRAQVRMMEAFTRKAGLPHATLDDDSLLVTRGEADPQRPGHLRWVEYETLEDMARLFASPAWRLYARGGSPLGVAHDRIGQAHRPGTDRFEAARRRVAAWQAQASR